MAKAKIARDGAGNFFGIHFRCPGCASEHGGKGGVSLPVSNWRPPNEVEGGSAKPLPHWTFNGDFENPTFHPSVLSRYEYPAEDGQPAVKFTCHSWVRNGRIEFLSDCTHALAGKTVDLPILPDEGEA